MTMQAIDPKLREWSFGKLSVQIAVWLFVGMAILLIAFYQIPQKPPSRLQDVASTVVVIAVFAVAPLGHLAGLVLAVMAFFRPADRHGFAVFGVLLNIGVVAFGIFLVTMAAIGLSGFR